MIYSVTTNEKLRELCIRHGWFTCGNNEQYEKLFNANQNLVSIDDIAFIIWVCSDNEYTIGAIKSVLREEREKYWCDRFGVDLKGTHLRFRIYNLSGDCMECNFCKFLEVFCDPYNHQWTMDTIASIEGWVPYDSYRTFWKRVNAEWVPHMKAYRLYEPVKPYNTISYERDLESAEAKHPEYRIREIDSDTLHIELQ